jgi:hypothetical protein
MAEEEDDTPTLQETFDTLDALLAKNGPLPRRQAVRDSRSVPYGDPYQQGVYFPNETRQAHDAMTDAAVEVARQRNLAERNALNDYAATQADFWDRKLAEERRDRHR